jgi:hypothetical protein
MKEVAGSMMFIVGGLFLIIFNRTVAGWTQLSYASRVNRWIVWLSNRFALARVLILPPKYYHLYWIGAGILMMLVGVVDLARAVMP